MAPSKHKPNKGANVGLGALVDVSRVHSEGVATVEPDPVKRDRMLERLRALKAARVCTAEQAEEVVGKCR